MSDSYRERIWDEFSKAVQVFDKKNEDYGDAWRANGWRGNLSRIFEKDQRVRNLLWRSDPRTPAVGDEQAIETLRDMLNTIVFAIINLEDEVEYGHETPRPRRLSELEKGYAPGVATAFYDQVSAETPHPQPVAFAPGEPGYETQVVAHGHGEVVRTEVISTEQLREAVVGNNPQALVGAEVAVSLPQGPDEVRTTEADHSGHVRKRPNNRQRVVTDSPQA